MAKLSRVRLRFECPHCGDNWDLSASGGFSAMREVLKVLNQSFELHDAACAQPLPLPPKETT